MKRLTTASILGSLLALAACGGSTHSGNDPVVIDPTPTPAAAPTLTPTPVLPPCDANGNPNQDGDGSAANPFIICNAGRLMAMQGSSSAWLLAADLDMTAPGVSFSPLLTFKGTFDGGGHTIFNLTPSLNPTSLRGGLFNSTQNATLENLHLVNVKITGDAMYETGALVGITSKTTIKNVSASGSILVAGSSGTLECIGGLVGYPADSTTIDRSSSTVMVSASYAKWVGGLVGCTQSSVAITNSYATGAVTGMTYVGGLAGGLYNSSVDKSYSAGLVQGAGYVGGLVGYNYGTVTDSFWDMKDSNLATSSGGVGLADAAAFETTTPSDASSPFKDWDTTIWLFSATDFPRLQ